FLHEQMNLHRILEAQRTVIITRGMNSWPTHVRRSNLAAAWCDGKAQRAEEAMLGRLHEPEEIRVMHDAGHVGIAEFHPSLRFEFVRHDGSVDFLSRIS